MRDTITANYSEPSLRVRGMYGSIHTDVLEGKRGVNRKQAAAFRMHGEKSAGRAGGISRKKTEKPAAVRTIAAARPFPGAAAFLPGHPVKQRFGTADRSEKNDRDYYDVVSGYRIRTGSELISLRSLRSLGRFITLRGVILSLLALAAISAAVILMLFNFDSAVIYGNTKYSEKQIEEFITRGNLGENTFLMAIKYHHRKVTEIPFVDQIDIDIVTPSTIRVNIKEKPLDGCIACEDYNVYFSKEGIIQAISGRTVEEAAVVRGTVPLNPEPGKEIAAENQSGIDQTLELLRSIDRYHLKADFIDIDENNNLSASFGDVKVRLGKSGYDSKMYRIHQIFPYLAGKEGEISMTGYNYTSKNVVLSPSDGIKKRHLKSDKSPEGGSDPKAAAEKKKEDKEEKETEEKKAEEKKTEEKQKDPEKDPLSEKTAEKDNSKQKPAEEKAAEGADGRKKPAEEKAAEEADSRKKPAEEKAAEGADSRKKPAEEKAAEGADGRKKPAEEKAAKGADGRKKPAENKAVKEENPEKKSAEKETLKKEDPEKGSSEKKSPVKNNTQKNNTQKRSVNRKDSPKEDTAVKGSAAKDSAQQGPEEKKADEESSQKGPESSPAGTSKEDGSADAETKQE